MSVKPWPLSSRLWSDVSLWGICIAGIAAFGDPGEFRNCLWTRLNVVTGDLILMYETFSEGQSTSRCESAALLVGAPGPRFRVGIREGVT